MTIEDLVKEVEAMLKALRVPYKKTQGVRKSSYQFICEMFGLVVSVTTEGDLGSTRDTVLSKTPNFRYCFVTGISNSMDFRQELIWALAEGGYLGFIRTNFPRQFAELLTMQDFGKKIIDERLKRWNNLPKYRFLIEENEKARKISANVILAVEPGFFDYMPAKEEGGIYYAF